MSFRFADLFAGIGGFHAALSHAGGECVYVSEIDEQALDVYAENWLRDPHRDLVVNHDITQAVVGHGDLDDVPVIDVLTAGFPCQPFSKSGFQRGMEETRGSLFWDIARILEHRRPRVILLENVRNLIGPRHEHEWDVIITTLFQLGYQVSRTPTVLSPHVIHPLDGGTPQVRERVFIAATYVEDLQPEDERLSPELVMPTLSDWTPRAWDPLNWRVDWILDSDASIPDLKKYMVKDDQRAWIDTWDRLILRLPWWRAPKVQGDTNARRLPGFPLWAEYWKDKYLRYELTDVKRMRDDRGQVFPAWKVSHVWNNIKYYKSNRGVIRPWTKTKDFRNLPPSRKKLEWQAQHEESLWDTLMHFRPSGIRAKRATYFPALVAINQTSVIGPRKRVITPHEAARLQGLGRDFYFPDGQADPVSYRQVGNGVCVGAAWRVLVEHVRRDKDLIAVHNKGLVDAILEADQTHNPSRDSVVIPQESEAGPTAMSA